MRRQGGGKFLLIGLVLALLGGGAWMLMNAKLFESEPPKIVLDDKIYWNLQSPLPIVMEDASGIKSYKIVLDDGKNSFEIADTILPNPQKRISVDLKLPRAGWNRRTTSAVLTVEAVDGSRRNIVSGNAATVRAQIQIDTKRPTLTVLQNSYSIAKGGSALVVFEAHDGQQLKEVAIETAFGKRFLAQPFYKDGFYAALIAWPITEERFKAWVQARDMAGNTSRAHIPLYLQDKKYRTSKIRLTERFLNGKIVELAQDFEETAQVQDPVERFRLINEDMRKKSEDKIHTITQQISQDLLSGWKIHPFYPLKNGKTVANFGDFRIYYYNKRRVSQSYHLGVDLASIKMADIRLSNDGQVVYADYNGLYGNMPIISHGLGLYSLYGHCSSIMVGVGEELKRGEKFAKTGSTGLALGDHLHFGMLVQGIEVWPIEWMDGHWIKDNVTDILVRAKTMIDRR